MSRSRQPKCPVGRGCSVCGTTAGHEHALVRDEERLQVDLAEAEYDSWWNDWDDYWDEIDNDLRDDLDLDLRRRPLLVRLDELARYS